METLYTAEEVAKMLRVSLQAVRKWRQDGKLKAYKVGHSVRFTESAIKEMIREG